MGRNGNNNFPRYEVDRHACFQEMCSHWVYFLLIRLINSIHALLL
jgi:hypothetical protein